MKRSCLRSVATVICTAALAACGSSSSNPAQPSGTSSGSATAGVTSSVVAPRPLTPANQSQVKYGSQPVVLSAGNGLVTNGANATYTFEVATDTAFSNKVQVKDQVPQGSNGQTSVTLDQLAGGTDYYWHVRAEGGGTTGVFSQAFKFTVGPAVVLQPPVPVSPANGSVTAGWPSLTVSNAARSGPAGTITYQFQVSTSANFSSVLVSGTVNETPNVTSYSPPPATPPPSTTTLYWRATATDQTNGVSSASSAVWSFTFGQPTTAGQIAAQEGIVLWTGVQPPGTGGHITFGGGWGIYTAVVNGQAFTSPATDELRVVDLLDRGMDPQSAIYWMQANGYSTPAAYYPAIGVIAFPLDYMAYVSGTWSLVVNGSRG